MKYPLIYLFVILAIGLAVVPVKGEGLNDQSDQSDQEMPKRIPNFEDIELQSNDPLSEFYFDQLMLRYSKNDSTLNLIDYYYLYYGSAFQASYNPLAVSPYADSLHTILASANLDKRKVVFFIEKTLEVNPFSLRNLNALAYVQALSGDTLRAENQLRKVEMLAQTILLSGTGLTRDKAWFVAYKSDITDFLDLMNVKVSNVIPITIDIEFVSKVLPVGAKQRAANSPKIKGYYFNYQLVNRYVIDNATQIKAQADKGKRKMEFNPLYNPRSDKSILPPSKRGSRKSK